MHTSKEIKGKIVVLENVTTTVNIISSIFGKNRRIRIFGDRRKFYEIVLAAVEYEIEMVNVFNV